MVIRPSALSDRCWGCSRTTSLTAFSHSECLQNHCNHCLPLQRPTGKRFLSASTPRVSFTLSGATQSRPAWVRPAQLRFVPQKMLSQHTGCSTRHFRHSRGANPPARRPHQHRWQTMATPGSGGPLQGCRADCVPTVELNIVCTSRYQSRVDRINALEGAMAQLSDMQLAAKTKEFRERLAQARWL